MPIILVTAANGHGKGQWAIREILRLQDENDKREKQGKPRRIIYTNIHGINEDGRPKLKDCHPIPDDKIFFGKQDDPEHPPPEGYFLPPIGSVFMYDEAQEIDWIKQKSGALSNDIRVKSLEKHRHAGLDIYFITQSPNYIHSHIFGLVSPHIYLERPLGQPFSNVFTFNKPQPKPENSTKKADDQSVITLSKKYGKYYKSSAEHNMKGKFPLKIKLLLGFLVLCILYTLFNYTKTKKYKESQAPQAQQAVSATAPTSSTSVTAPTSATAQTQLLEQEHQIELLKAENQMYKDRLTVTYQVEAKNAELRVAGVYSGHGVCRAYNTYGDLLTMPQVECKTYLSQVGKMLRARQTNPIIEPAQIPQTTQVVDEKSAKVEPIKPTVSQSAPDMTAFH